MPELREPAFVDERSRYKREPLTGEAVSAAVDAAPVASLGAQRFNRGSSRATDKSIPDMLQAAMLEAGNFQHAIVIMGRIDENGQADCSFFQAGAYTAHAQLGLIFDATVLLRNA